MRRSQLNPNASHHLVEKRLLSRSLRVFLNLGRIVKDTRLFLDRNVHIRLRNQVEVLLRINGGRPLDPQTRAILILIELGLIVESVTEARGSSHRSRITGADPSSILSPAMSIVHLLQHGVVYGV